MHSRTNGPIRRSIYSTNLIERMNREMKVKDATKLIKNQRMGTMSDQLFFIEDTMKHLRKDQPNH